MLFTEDKKTALIKTLALTCDHPHDEISVGSEVSAPWGGRSYKATVLCMSGKLIRLKL